MKWEQRIFDKRKGAAEIPCACCERTMYIPPSKVGQKATCSSKCRDTRAADDWSSLERPCETCGETFRPRPIQVAAGRGRFCSQACNTAARTALHAPEVKAKAAEKLREGYASGEITKPIGSDSPLWKGGLAISRVRRRQSGKEAASLRAYRAANPDKVREFSQRRSGRMIDRLPRGTLSSIRLIQKDRCAICRAAVKGRGHFDHITPLAKGGKHEGRNIQLLCAPCNLRKNARDPIDHMQSLGWLL